MNAINGSEASKEIKEVKRGVLKKRNEYYMKQARTFILTTEPRLSYYKNDTEFKVRSYYYTTNNKVHFQI